MKRKPHEPLVPTGRLLSLRFVPLQAVAALCDDPAAGLQGQRDAPVYQYDAATRQVVAVNSRHALARLPDGYEAVLVNTEEPVDVCMWVVGKAEDARELAAAVADFQRARERLLDLLAPD